ncbi:multiple sugar transport system permease protein [Kribbella voronezhensis]|uniref:Multiple sugar transport system permease protein n=1 Tax=Kribbella voronezhensis TaxID=2512212 RepID=A0A4R7T8M9_9ACTN|nr:carbohydrate ABC transporter permease [Kribbella voronezhensis]TDU88302.1 multiple sugar transport system permease protein [Kribbella voronezhensis]
MANIQRSGSDKAGSVIRYVVLGVGAVFFLLPFYLLLRNGLSTEADITSPTWKLFPSTLHWSNISDLFSDPAVPMARSLVNSLVIAVVQTVGVLVISGLAGYGLARIPFRYANAVFYFIVATLLIPAAVTFVPSFVLVSSLGWVSTLRGLIVPGLFQAFATFLFRQYFLNFPRELEEAAQLDGTAYWGTFWRIVVPNSAGFIAAIGTITFIGSWNAFLWPLVIAPDQNSWTVQIALSTFLTAQTINLPQLFIAASIAILPLVVMFVFLQRWIVEGVERSGISE